MLYTHDRCWAAVVHEASGLLALADLALASAARPDETRTGFPTYFTSLHDIRRLLKDPDAFPRGEMLTQPIPELARWRDAVVATLDGYVRMPSLERYFADLQGLWASGPAPETNP